MKSKSESIHRRTMLKAVAAGIGAAAVAPVSGEALAGQLMDETAGDGARRLVSELGERSPYEKPRRVVRRRQPSANSRSPIQEFDGIITPADLHYERHHVGVPIVDPDKYTLTIDGMVERPTTYKLSELKQFIPESHFYYVECGSNGGSAFARIKEDQTPQDIDGRSSTSEWTGVPLSALLQLAGVKEGATWLVADGHDEGAWKRSYPIEKGWDDALLAYAQNGEAVRPEQGYPVRLHLPGWGAGNHMKWVRHIEVTDAPFLTEAEAEDNDETPAERAKRMLASVRGAKSIITSPAYPNVVSPGYSLVKGVAWSGRGKITQVDITTDGGKTWEAATLTGPVFPKCQTRFAYRWNWDGREAMLMSRAKDETGNVQLSLEEVRAGIEADTLQNQNNNIRAWKVAADGSVVFGLI